MYISPALTRSDMQLTWTSKMAKLSTYCCIATNYINSIEYQGLCLTAAENH